MTAGISAVTNYTSQIDLINGNNGINKTDKNRAIEDIFSEISDKISEDMERQFEQKNKNIQIGTETQAEAECGNENKFDGIILGPPVGMQIENFDYYSY